MFGFFRDVFSGEAIFVFRGRVSIKLRASRFNDGLSFYVTVKIVAFLTMLYFRMMFLGFNGSVNFSIFCPKVRVCSVFRCTIRGFRSIYFLFDGLSW